MLREVLTARGRLGEEADARLKEVVSEVGLDSRQGFLSVYPHQLSGGQQQRVAIAMAFACRPRLIVLDEPTTGLDVTTQRTVLETVARMCASYGVAAVYVSHDVVVVGELSKRVAVVYSGRVVETGATADVFGAPAHPYTQGLLRAVPSPERSGRLVGMEGVPPRPGQRPAGCGFAPRCPFVMQRCTAGLHTNWTGQVRYSGQPLTPGIRRRPKEVLRGIQYVFQNPYASLNPRRTVGGLVAQPVETFAGSRRARADDNEILNALRAAALSVEVVNRYPDQLSGA